MHGARDVIDRQRLDALLEREIATFRARTPRSRELYERARGSLVGGVTMPWMMRWAGGYPTFAVRASGARITDVDGHEYIDLALGDTGAMAGHSPRATVDAITAQAGRGITTMLPSEDGVWVAEELTRRFTMARWMFTLTATDANRAALRLARQITGRPKVLVHSYCYHGSVDEAFAVTGPAGTVSREGNVGPAVDPATTTVAVEFNDVDGLERALAGGEIAVALAEPALTNMGIVLPEPGYHDALRELTRKAGTLLIIDETHTFSAGPGGCTRAWGLDPDMVTIGKSIGGGVPSGALGLADDVVTRMFEQAEADYEDTGGVGGTLAGNPFSSAAMRATLEHVLTAEAFERMTPLATRFAAGVQQAIDAHDLSWNISQLGCRAEYQFLPQPARDGTTAYAAHDGALERYLHLHALNRGVMITPFHNMALVSPATTPADIDAHTIAFGEAVGELAG